MGQVMIEWLLNNKEWIFSGIGAALIPILIGAFKFFVHPKASLPSQNNQTQRGGKLSTNIQIHTLNIEAGRSVGEIKRDTLNFKQLCSALQPVIQENGRIFRDFGPNSGASSDGVLRTDLSVWYAKRPKIVENNSQISDLIRSNLTAVPAEHYEIFTRLLSHIDAFEAHVLKGGVDYREHQFPKEIVVIINEGVAQ
jgi:hypothetical protein